MNRQGSGPDRAARGRAGDAAFRDRDAYQRDSYLEASAYPVDPGYQGYASGRERERPRPADVPPGPSRTRPERGVPNRPGYPPRPGRPAAYDPESPWQRPEDAMPGVGRPRPRPSGPRPRQAPPGQPRPGQQRSAPPRGPRPAGSYESQRPGPYVYAPGPGQDAMSQAAGAQVPGYPGRPGYPGPGSPGQQPPGYHGQNVPGQQPQAFPGQAPGPHGQPREGHPPGWQPGAGSQPAQEWPAQDWTRAGATGQPGAGPPGHGQAGAAGFQAEQPPPGQPRAGWPGAGPGTRPGQGPYGQGQPGSREQPGYAQPGYGQGEPGQGSAGYGQGLFTGEPPGPGQFGQFGQFDREQGPPGQGPFGQAPFGQPPMSGPAGPMPFVAGPYSNTNAYGAGQNQRNTGSWQAAGPQQAPDWVAAQGPLGPNARNGVWHAAEASQGPDWATPQQPYGQGGNPNAGDGWQAPGNEFGAGQRNTGSWQAAGPQQPGPGWAQGQGWAPGAGGHGVRDTGAWQAAGPQQSPGWGADQGQYADGQFGQGARNTGAWQAAGPGPGQQPYGGPPPQGQPYPGQPYPGQQHPGQPYPGAGGPGMRDTGGFSHAGGPIIRQRDSALPDPQPSAKGPIAAIETDNVAAFARDLRVLRSKAGLDYPDMAEKSHYTMRTLASAAGGLRLPTLPVLIAYVNACGGDVGEWEERWGKLTKTGKKGQVALLPAGGQAPAGQPGQGPVPPGPRQTGEIYVITSAKQRDAQW